MRTRKERWRRRRRRRKIRLKIVERFKELKDKKQDCEE
jgi:hypothetical protein